MDQVKIKEIAIYHPDNKVENDYYIQHFQEKGRDISKFLEAMGKKERYIINNQDENGITMAIEAAKKVLEKANLQGSDIDYIVFSTQVPERTFPINALHIHRAIGARTDTISVDSNANCAGMTVAVEQACRYIQANANIHRALVIGSDYLSLIANPEEEITYATYGDAACAVILEKTKENSGFMDAKYHSYTEFIDCIVYPEDGLTKAIKEQENHQKYVHFKPFDPSFGTPIIFEQIQTLLDEQNLKASDIKAFCISQFALSDANKIKKHFDLQDEQMIYIGDQFGYTGSSSPFIALYEGINRGQIKRGDYIIFWTIGAGHQFIAMLFKY